VPDNTQQNIRIPVDNDNIGCCHSYYDCSVEKKCISPIFEIYLKCEYRKNLEAGRIFYSKNANDFSMQKYNEIQIKYNHLDRELRMSFELVLHYFICYKRLLEYELFLRTNQLNRLVKSGLLIDIRTDPHRVLDLFLENYLLTLISDKSKYREIVKCLKSSLPSSDKFERKKELIDYIIKDDFLALERFYEKYIFVNFNSSLFAYFQEIYLDYGIDKVITYEKFNNFLMESSPPEKEMMLNKG